HEASFRVAPRAEILDVEIADGEHDGRVELLRAVSPPLLQPAIERSAQEHERALTHALMLGLEILRADGDVRANPRFVRARRLVDVHAILPLLCCTTCSSPSICSHVFCSCSSC